MKSNFVDLCERVADQLDIELIDVFNDGGSPSAFEDDGVLHVIEGTERACFDVGDCQRLSPSKQNARTRKVMKLLGRHMTEEVLA